jgi:cell division protein FtsL
MNRLNLLLLAALFGSALVLVDAAYETRRLHAAKASAQFESARLENQRKQLEAERQRQATTVHVDATARERLQMRVVTPAITMYEGSAYTRTAQSAPMVHPTAGRGR